ncbi:hypothetical protein [Bacillus cereus group sp. BfR-BA-01441]|uniref:TlpA family protein disulfide reductase n=1 Tax=Bacillus cereus group sp. BfR-BA-01441 TaxID=2920348 RepID=UPI001F5986FE
MNFQLEGHRKFFKFLKSVDVGDYLNNPYLDKAEEQKLHDFIKGHLLILFYSTSCEGCLPAIKALDDFLQKGTPLNVLILIDTNRDNFEYMKSMFEGRASVFICEMEKMKNELNVRGVPSTYLINQLGQVLYAVTGYEDDMLEKLTIKFKGFLEN